MQTALLVTNITIILLFGATSIILIKEIKELKKAKDKTANALKNIGSNFKKFLSSFDSDEEEK